VTLVRADTNQEFDVELPDDANVAELLPALVKELGLPLTGPDGNQVAYELSNKRTGREYKEGTTLGGEGTKTGDSLLLTSTFVAGGFAHIAEVGGLLVTDKRTARGNPIAIQHGQDGLGQSIFTFVEVWSGQNAVSSLTERATTFKTLGAAREAAARLQG
jgi:hypothetical protein